MNRSAAATALLCLSLLPAACISQQQQQQRRVAEAAAAAAHPKLRPPLHLGSVHQVYPEQGFALLRIIGPMPGPGVTLITHPANGSNERIGNLCISSQQPSRDGIVAADIRSGTVVKGDRVFRYRNISEPDATDDIIAAERPTGLAPETTDGGVDDAPIPPPVTQSEQDAPIPAPLSVPTVETTVLPTTAPATPGSDPGAPSAPAQAPGYLDSIPDSIDDWD